MRDSIINALSGPSFTKLALAALLAVAFFHLRTKDTEGVMAGYALLASFLVFREIAFAIFPSAFLFAASDLALACGLLYLCVRPFRLGWYFWIPLVLSIAAFTLLALEAIGFDLALPTGTLRLAALAPALALAALPLLFRADADSPARSLALRSWLPLAAGTVLYIGAGSAAGIESPIFNALFVPLYYGLLFFIALLFSGILQAELVEAVDYYEESADSLYALLLSAGASDRGSMVLQDIVDNMLRSIVERTGADGGILLLADDLEETVSVRALHGSYPPPFKLPESLPREPERVESFLRHARFRLGEGILGEVSRTGKHVFVPQASPSSGLPDNGDEDWLKVGAFIVAPLILRDRIIGAVSVAKKGGGKFAERDFDRCKLLADFGCIVVASFFSFLEAAEHRDIALEADIAARLQSGLLPEKLPELLGLSFGAFSNPARGVCSDYYDVIRTRHDRALLVVGDAAGKGISASVVLVMIRAILHLITASTKDAATLLAWVNRGISGKVDSDHFASLCLASVDASSGAIELACAGRKPVLLCRAEGGQIETGEAAEGLPLGVERCSAYSQESLVLGPGDVLVLYTDGIVEALDAQGRQYGLKGLAAALRRSRGLCADAIARAIGEDLERFAGRSRSRDDRTLLVMKRIKA